MKKIICLTILCFIAVLPVSSHATSIEQNVHDTGYYFGYGVFGQSFTATETSINSIKIVVGDWNKFLGSDFSLKLNLYAGSGFGGAVLATDSDTLPANFSDNATWWAFDFATPVHLTVGETYTFSVDSTNGDRGGIYMGSNNPYASGTAWRNGEVFNNYDLAFQIPADAAPSVPEPSTLLLLGGGLLGLGFARKRFAKK